MSKKAIIRLSRYKNALTRFRKMGCVKVFSDNLGDAVGVTSAQVRKDFSMFGICGYKRGGYKVEELLDKLNVILGKDRVHEVVLAGAGHIGKALMNYKGFEKEKMRIACVFDIDPGKFDGQSSLPVKHIDEMKNFVRENDIKIGIIAVPDIAAQHVLEKMTDAGITGVLNFAPIRLRGGDEIVVSNVNLALELETIIYFVNAGEKM